MTDRPRTLEEVFKNQKRVWRLVEAEKWPKGDNPRIASLKEGYRFGPAIEHGMGYYSINEETNEVCEVSMIWSEDGQILLCPECFLDGT